MKKYQSLVEYLLILTAISFLVLGAIQLLGKSNVKVFNTASNAIQEGIAAAEKEELAYKNQHSIDQFQSQVSAGAKNDVPSSGNSGSSSWKNPTAPVGNQPPIAKFEFKPSSNIGYNTKITFLDLSTDPDGDEIVKEEWVNRKETYPGGKNTVKLRVADSYGNWSAWYQADIMVGNSPPNKPVITMTPNTLTVLEGTPVTFTATATDPDGQTVTYLWTNVKPTYTEGTQTVTVQAKDPDGALSEVASITFDVVKVKPGVVASYNLNGAATDSTEYKNNGTLKNGTSFVNGVEGQATTFSGTSQHIYVPSSTSLQVQNAVTMEAWVNPTSAAGEKQIINKENAYELALHNGKLGIAIYSEGSSVGYWTWAISNDFVPLNTWSHVVGTYDGSKMRLYINGKLVLEDSREKGKIVSPTPNEPLIIGARGQGTASYFSGAIDQAKVYNIALSQSDLQTNYTTYRDKSINVDDISSNYWEMVTSTKSSGTNEAMYISVNKDSYTIPTDSYLQYDVYHDSTNAAFAGSVDLIFTNGTMRDYPNDGSSPIIKDMLGIQAHPATVVSPYAQGKWYRRNINLKDVAGKTIQNVLIAEESDSTGRVDFKVANIKIISNGQIVKIFSPQTPTVDISHSTNKQLLSFQYVQDSLQKGKIAQFNFDNSIMKNDLNFKTYSTNGATYTTGSKNTGLLVNGQHISVPINELDINNSDYVTVSFWYKWADENTVMPVAFTQYDYWCTGGSCGFNTGQGDVYGMTNPYNNTTYKHTVVVFKKGDATGGRIYINGVRQTTQQVFSQPLNSVAQFLDYFNISSWAMDSNYLMRGSSIDEIMIWNRALTDSEVASLYQQ